MDSVSADETKTESNGGTGVKRPWIETQTGSEVENNPTNSLGLRDGEDGDRTTDGAEADGTGSDPHGSGEDGDTQRQKRLELNRKAAQESRRRKKLRTEELQRSVVFLTRENMDLREQNDLLRQMIAVNPHIDPLAYDRVVQLDAAQQYREAAASKNLARQGRTLIGPEAAAAAAAAGAPPSVSSAEPTAMRGAPTSRHEMAVMPPGYPVDPMAGIAESQMAMLANQGMPRMANTMRAPMMAAPPMFSMPYGSPLAPHPHAGYHPASLPPGYLPPGMGVGSHMQPGAEHGQAAPSVVLPPSPTSADPTTTAAAVAAAAAAEPSPTATEVEASSKETEKPAEKPPVEAPADDSEPTTSAAAELD